MLKVTSIVTAALLVTSTASFADQDAILFKEFLQSKAGGSVKDDNILLIYIYIVPNGVIFIDILSQIGIITKSWII